MINDVTLGMKVKANVIQIIVTNRIAFFPAFKNLEDQLHKNKDYGKKPKNVSDYVTGASVKSLVLGIILVFLAQGEARIVAF